MGFMKEWRMEQQARGYFFVGDKYVCSECFDDYAICQFIEDRAQSPKCDYCGKSSDDSSSLIAAPIDEVVGFIVEGLESEWSDPDDEYVPYESAEGGYQAEVRDSYDLLFLVEIVTDTDNEDLVSDLEGAIGHRQWCRKNIWELPPERQLLFAWEAFSERVKYRTRYVFFRMPDAKEESGIVDDEKVPEHILDRLGKIVSKNGLVSILPKGTIITRVRVHKPECSFETSAQLGPPLPQDAKYSNRMSPAGIPMFYGAMDKETALAETRKEGGKSPLMATVATFETLQRFKVVDLTKLPGVPSLFDAEGRSLRPEAKFLWAFVRDISKPIEKDGREHIEYVSTQVVTEYFRHIYEDIQGDRVRGILYPSARASKGVSCVLFFENEDCCDKGQPTIGTGGRTKWLSLVKVERQVIGNHLACNEILVHLAFF